MCLYCDKTRARARAYYDMNTPQGSEKTVRRVEKGKTTRHNKTNSAAWLLEMKEKDGKKTKLFLNRSNSVGFVDEEKENDKSYDELYGKRQGGS